MERKEGTQKRKPVACPKCGKAMVCMNKVAPMYDERIKGFYVWYICPCRKKEKGCGYSVLLEVSPKTKNPIRTLNAFQAEKRLKHR